jgi:hypothetical protein
MAPKSKAVTVKDEFPITIPNEEAREILEANLGGESLSVRNLTRIKIPAGGGIAWAVPNLDGDEDMVKELEVLILHSSVNRAYWEVPYGEGEVTPPDCSSADAKFAFGDPFPDSETGERNPASRKCMDCPYSKFGSAMDKKGNPTKGQKCSMKRTIFFLAPGSWLPKVINVPAASLGNVTDYFVGLIGESKKIYHVITRLKLKKTKSVGGADFSKVLFSRVANLPEDRLKEINAYMDDPKTKEFFAQASSAMATEHVDADEPIDVAAAA